tara:strand:+ start:405 stop:605 length:201 start_codon:yes stop_codon:yes gene_type:complete
MESFPKFEDEYVDRLEISVTSRRFKVYGSDGGQQELNCETTDEFMRVLEVAKMASNIDKEIEVVYV